MKISQEVREFAKSDNRELRVDNMGEVLSNADVAREDIEAGMNEMSEKFKAEGSEIYKKVS